nr:TraW protein [Sodalis glossinidius]CAI59451.2 TraW protein [Sodalis glossinidius]
MAKDFGRLGEVYPVAEPDMLDTLTQRAKSLVDSGAWAQEMDAFTQRVERNSQRPAPVEGIGKSIHYSERFFDPSVVLLRDLQDMDGRVFARQGEVINPLATVPFAQTLYFIDGDDADQVAWMQRQRPQTLMVNHSGERRYSAHVKDTGQQRLFRPGRGAVASVRADDGACVSPPPRAVCGCGSKRSRQTTGHIERERDVYRSRSWEHESLAERTGAAGRSWAVTDGWRGCGLSGAIC